MRKQDQLQELIRSMTPAEKRYFKIQAEATGTGKNYMELFTLLAGQADYDADTFSKKTGKSKAVLAHNKEYLKSMLMRSLRLYDETDIYSYLTTQILEARVLHKRAMYAASLDVATAAYGKAVHYDEFNLALLLMVAQGNACLHLHDFDGLDKAMKVESALMSILSEKSQMNRLRNMCIPILQKGGDYSGLRAIAEHPLFQTPEQDLQSWTVKNFWNAAHVYYYYYYEKDYTRAMEHSARIVELFETNPHFIRYLANGAGYLDALHNQFIRLAGVRRVDEALAAVDRLIRITAAPSKDISHEVALSFGLSAKTNKLAFLVMLRSFAAAIDFAPVAEAIYEQLTQDLRFTYLLNLAVAQFHMKQYDDCHATMDQTKQAHRNNRARHYPQPQ